MPAWLENVLYHGNHVSVRELAASLALAFVLGWVVAGIYALTQRRPRVELIQFAATVVLLTILIAMVMQVIGNELARAFSLAGALAIIRFRTVVQDTRDTAFVIFAVVVGMAVGTKLAVISLVGIPFVALAAVLLMVFGKNGAPPDCDHSLGVRVGLGRDPGDLLRPVFEKHLTVVRLRSTTTARQGAALDLTYLVRLRRDNDATAFVAELNQVEGVQSVELRHL